MLEIKDSARKELDAFAWPGGYPIVYLARDGWRDDETGKLEVNKYDRAENFCCSACAKDAIQWPDIIVVGSWIHLEEEAVVCEYCSELIDSAYGKEKDHERRSREDLHGKLRSCST